MWFVRRTSQGAQCRCLEFAGGIEYSARGRAIIQRDVCSASKTHRTVALKEGGERRTIQQPFTSQMLSQLLVSRPRPEQMHWHSFGIPSCEREPPLPCAHCRPQSLRLAGSSDSRKVLTGRYQLLRLPGTSAQTHEAPISQDARQRLTIDQDAQPQR